MSRRILDGILGPLPPDYDVLFESPDNAEPVSPEIWASPDQSTLELLTDTPMSPQEEQLLSHLGSYGTELSGLFSRQDKVRSQLFAVVGLADHEENARSEVRLG